MSNMQLQLGFVIPTPNRFDLNNNHHGLEQLEAWNKTAAGCFSDKDCLKKTKRSFDQAFTNFKNECNKTKPLLVWSGLQPNEEEDDQKKMTSSATDENNDTEEDHDQVVGWPPIKTWRKKIFQQQTRVGRIGCR